MRESLPYIVTIICSLISGFVSFFVSRRQSKADIERLERQHDLDIEKEREKFAMQKEKLEIEHRHQLELLQKENENNISASLANTLVAEAIKIPEVRNQFTKGVRNSRKLK